ncbi:SEC-C domain-containing protein [Candidatus Bathyarchaeota archaeon]|nr:SEC-C domain-containing protein [Candidatus Bathyarchaeota archaeon]
MSCGCGDTKTTKSDDPCTCGSGKKFKDCCEK